MTIICSTHLSMRYRRIDYEEYGRIFRYWTNEDTVKGDFNEILEKGNLK